MKSKATTYILLAAVLAVWGVILWKITASPEDTGNQNAVMPIATKPAAQPDTLLLNYADPFLKGIIRESKPELRSENIVRPLPRPSQAPVQREECPLRYRGIIRHGSTINCIVEYNGEHHTITRGGQIAGFVLSAIHRDSIILSKAGLNYSILIEE